MNPLLVIAMLAVTFLLLAGVTMEIDNYIVHRAATLESDNYLDDLLDEIVYKFLAFEHPSSDLRNNIYEFEERSEIVNRPKETWALIPYAETLLVSVS